MNARVAEASGIAALAILATVVVSASVLRAPSERLFGQEIVGRHHDPFTVMEQFGQPITLGAYLQPLTDVPGTVLARVSGPVAAYNWLVLLTFPLSAVATYLLARHLELRAAPAAIAAMLFAFSPFHLAHAAYHPHIAQTQWIPLFLLALWRSMDHATWKAATFVVLSTVGVTLSNFYGGLIAAVITPAAVASYWFFKTRRRPCSRRDLVRTAATLVCLGVAAFGYARYTAAAVISNPHAYAADRDDLFRYSAKWWSYLVPPVAHPVWGAGAQRLWADAGVSVGLLEQQVSLGWAVVVLGTIAIGAAVRGRGRIASVTAVPVLAVVALVALVCSLSPERTVGSFTFVRPAALLYSVLPMFRSYARFGVIVQLMAALLAAIGVEQLRSVANGWARIACGALLVLGAAEYAVRPSAMSRDVLPTIAHRWVADLPGRVHALDCAPLTNESQSIQWLSASRISLETIDLDDCIEPNLADKLSAGGYTHLLVRAGTGEAAWFGSHAMLQGFSRGARFVDGEVFAVTAPRPAVYTAAMESFLSREINQAWTWRWMGRDAWWSVVNGTDRPLLVTADVEMSAFPGERRLELQLDGDQTQTLTVAVSRRVTRVGPFTLPPGTHRLTWHALEPAAVAHDYLHNSDRRPLAVAIGSWHWTIEGETP